MIWVVALTLGTVIAAGTYLALSRKLLRCLIGLAMIGNGVNLLVFAAGRLISPQPPIIAAGEQQLDTAANLAANPLPQALVLTAIVIGFVLLCFSLVLAVRLRADAGTDDLDAMRAAEPPPLAPDQPRIEEAG